MIKIVISDSGPLISLANANALDLLLNFEPGVEVVVTDIVYLNSDHPAIVLFEDKWFLDPKRLKASSNIVSTCAFVKAALARNLISQKRYSEIIGTLKMFKRNLQMVETDTERERSLGNR